MWGVRVLHNFGRLANEEIDVERAERKARERGTKRVDEEERMEGGLRGRLSAGAELYFSLKEKSAGGTSDCTSPTVVTNSMCSIHRTSIHYSNRRLSPVSFYRSHCLSNDPGCTRTNAYYAHRNI
jgi:hypothetical protein